MKCPNCGEEMIKSKCLRCGYVVKDLSVNVHEDEKKEEEDETIDVDPSKVRISGGSAGSGGGSLFDDMFGGLGGFGGGIFGGLFGGILDDIFGLGDAYGSYNVSYGDDEYEDEEDEGEVVEIKHVEYLDEDGNPLDKKGNKRSDKHSRKHRRNDDK